MTISPSRFLVSETDAIRLDSACRTLHGPPPPGCESLYGACPAPVFTTRDDDARTRTQSGHRSPTSPSRIPQSRHPAATAAVSARSTPGPQPHHGTPLQLGLLPPSLGPTGHRPPGARDRAARLGQGQTGRPPLADHLPGQLLQGPDAGHRRDPRPPALGRRLRATRLSAPWPSPPGPPPTGPGPADRRPGSGPPQLPSASGPPIPAGPLHRHEPTVTGAPVRVHPTVSPPPLERPPARTGRAATPAPSAATDRLPRSEPGTRPRWWASLGAHSGSPDVLDEHLAAARTDPRPTLAGATEDQA